MSSEEIISSGLLELYVAGLASAEEVQQVQLWANQFPEVAAELSEIEVGIENYAKEFSTEPHPSVKEKIFQRINEGTTAKIISIESNTTATAQESRVVSIPSYWKTAAAAAIIFLAGSVALNVVLYNKNSTSQQELLQTQNLLGSLEEKTKVIEEKNKFMQQDMNVVQSKYSLPVTLDGQTAAPEAAAKVFWMKNTGEVYIDPSNLPEAPSGKQYQLWAFVDGKPVDGGLIFTTKKGNKYQIQKMKSFEKVQAFAVTLEVVKEKPAVAPEGPIFVMGKM